MMHSEFCTFQFFAISAFTCLLSLLFLTVCRGSHENKLPKRIWGKKLTDALFAAVFAVITIWLHSTVITFCWIFCHDRPHTIVKNARNMKSVSQAKLPPYFEGIFKFWTHEQQELPFLQMFISFGNQNLAVLCRKRFSSFLEFFMLYEYMNFVKRNIAP